MKKVLKWILIVVLAIILLAAIFTAISALHKDSRSRTVKDNAIRYIEKKYGFTPKIISCEQYYDTHVNFDILISYSKTPTDFYKVKMEHEGKSFTAFVPFVQDSDEGLDDYQSDEIDAAVSEKVSEFLGETGDSLLEVSLYAERGIGTPTFFDGNNLSEMLAEYELSRVMVHTTGYDVRSIDIQKLKDYIGTGQVYIFDYTSSEVYQETKDFNLMNLTHLSTWGEEDSDGLLLLPFMDEYYYVREDREPTYIRNNLKEIDGILYGSYEEIAASVVRSDRSFDMSSWDYSNPLDNTYTQRSDTYLLNSDAKRMFIFIPYKKYGLESRYASGCFLAKEYSSGEKRFERADFYSIFGIIPEDYPYAVYNIDVKDIGKDVKPENIFFIATGTDQ